MLRTRMLRTLADLAVAIFTAPSRIADRFDHWLEARRRQRAEEYLSKAESLYDLEGRMRHLAEELDYPRFRRQF